MYVLESTAQNEGVEFNRLWVFTDKKEKAMSLRYGALPLAQLIGAPLNNTECVKSQAIMPFPFVLVASSFACCAFRNCVRPLPVGSSTVCLHPFLCLMAYLVYFTYLLLGFLLSQFLIVLYFLHFTTFCLMCWLFLFFCVMNVLLCSIPLFKNVPQFLLVFFNLCFEAFKSLLSISHSRSGF